MSALVKYDAARYALQQAVEIDEVKDIRDKAEAMAAYARQAKDTEMIQWVTEIKVRAERRAGQMLADMPKAIGTKGQFAGGNTIVPPAKTAKTLSELGITKNESSRWQKLAAVDDDKFEKAVSAAKEVAGEVTTAAMLRVERDARADTPVTSSAPAKPKPVPESEAPPDNDEAAMQAEMMHDALEELRNENESLRNQIAAMLFTGNDEERAEYLDRLNALTEENKKLRILNDGLTSSRDRFMRENVSLRKQGEYAAKKLKALDRVHA